MTQPDTIRTFRVASPLRMLTPLILVSIVTVAMLYLISEPDDRVAALVVGLVLLFSIALAAWLLTRTRLEVTPQGITYHAIGYRVRSSWDNIEGYGKRVQGAHSLDCLILREPGMELSNWMRIGYQWLPLMNVVALLSGRAIQPNQLDRYAAVIPVEMFDKDWRATDLGRLIQRNAPQAYDNLVM